MGELLHQAPFCLAPEIRLRVRQMRRNEAEQQALTSSICRLMLCRWRGECTGVAVPPRGVHLIRQRPPIRIGGATLTHEPFGREEGDECFPLAGRRRRFRKGNDHASIRGEGIASGAHDRDPCMRRIRPQAGVSAGIIATARLDRARCFLHSARRCRNLSHGACMR